MSTTCADFLAHVVLIVTRRLGPEQAHPAEATTPLCPSKVRNRRPAGTSQSLTVRSRSVITAAIDKNLPRHAPKSPTQSSAAAAETHRRAVLDHLQAVSIQLRLVDPSVAGRHAPGRYGAAGLDEAERGHGFGRWRLIPVIRNHRPARALALHASRGPPPWTYR